MSIFAIPIQTTQSLQFIATASPNTSSTLTSCPAVVADPKVASTLPSEFKGRRALLKSALALGSFGCLSELLSSKVFDTTPKGRAGNELQNTQALQQSLQQSAWSLLINDQYLPNQIDALIAHIQSNPGRFVFNYAQIKGHSEQAATVQQFKAHYSLKLEEVVFKDWQSAHTALSKGLVDIFFAPTQQMFSL